MKTRNESRNKRRADVRRIDFLLRLVLRDVRDGREARILGKGGAGTSVEESGEHSFEEVRDFQDGAEWWRQGRCVRWDRATPPRRRRRLKCERGLRPGE